jgi:PAS domain S-box-containing protein
MLEKLIKFAEYFPYCVTIVDVKQIGRPCLYANEKFFENTGYQPQEAIGRNLAFLQGEATQEESRNFMRKAFRDGAACIQDLINYKKDGTPFLNRLMMVPLEQANRGTHIYIGIQNDVTESRGFEHDNSLLSKVTDGEIKHHINNALTIIFFTLESNLRKAKSPEEIQHSILLLTQTFSRINEFVLNAENISELDSFDPSSLIKN